MEPNNDLINANVPLFAGFAGNGSTAQQTGWKVSGGIHDIDDLRDSFMLTPRRTYRYRVALCPPEGTSCQDQVGIDPFTVFWRVLDQDGNELLTSEVSASNKNFITLDAGVLYYVTVDAGDTMGVEVGYQLYVYELQ